MSDDRCWDERADYEDDGEILVWSAACPKYWEQKLIEFERRRASIEKMNRPRRALTAEDRAEAAEMAEWLGRAMR